MARTELQLTGATLEAQLVETNKLLEITLAKAEALTALLTALRQIESLNREEAELEKGRQ